MNAQLAQAPVTGELIPAGLPAEVAANAEVMALPDYATRTLAAAREMAAGIDTPEVAAIVVEDVARIKSRLEKINEQRFAITRPMDAAKAAVMALFNPVTTALDESIAILRTGLATFAERQRVAAENARREAEAQAERERQEAERAAQAAADEAAQAQREAEAAAQRAEDTGSAEDRQVAQAAAEVAAQATARAADAEADSQATMFAPAVPAVVTSKVAGLSTRAKWDAAIVDMPAFLTAAAANPAAYAHLVQQNATALRQWATQTKGAVQVPGINVTRGTTAAVRR